MLSFLIFCLVTQITISIDICFWGREGTNSHINGQYTETGIWNGYPYYTMTVDSTCSSTSVYHLYYRLGAWWIAATLDSQSNLAYCQNSNNNPTTTGSGGCNNKWNIDTIDTNIQVTYGRCPEWNCDEITTSWPSSHPCGSIFDTHSNINEWRGNHNIYGTTYLYFHPQLFKFVCDTTLKYTCPSIFEAADLSSNGWLNISAGASADMDWSSGRYEALTCIVTITPSPTTQFPTTQFPTTYAPTTATPTTVYPTTSIPTTAVPTSAMPTIMVPTIASPTTSIPSTTIPNTVSTTTLVPSTIATSTSTIATITSTIATSTSTNTQNPRTDNPTYVLSTVVMLPTHSPINIDVQVSKQITTFSPHKRQHLQNEEESYFIIIIISILLVVICITCIAVCVIVRRKRRKNRENAKAATIIGSIELANNVNKSNENVIKETKFAPQSIVKVSFTEKSGESGNTTASLMKVVSLSDMNSVTSGGDSNHIDTTPTNTETTEDDINHNMFGEGHGNESDSDLYEVNNNNNNITPGITAGNDEITPQ
eukprot:31148_1